MKKLVLLVLLFVANALLAQEPPLPRIVQTKWISQSKLAEVSKWHKDNRHFPSKVIGKINPNGVISYKGEFTPFPSNLDKYQSFWGMTTRWYLERKIAFENDGYEEVWHQSFYDSVGVEIHQVVWAKFHPNQPEQRHNGATKPPVVM